MNALLRSGVSMLALSTAPLAGCVTDDEPTWGMTSAELRTGHHAIRAVHSAKCLDVAGGAPTNGTMVEQQPCATSGDQDWLLGSVGGDVFEVMVAASGRCLDVKGRSVADGAAVHAWTCHGNDNQRWRLVFAGDARYELRAVHSGKCLRVADGGTQDGARLVQATCTGASDQRFTFKRLDGRFGAWVTPGADGKLAYKADDRGNRIPDFSSVGYRGGGVALPTAPVRRTLSASASGDDGARIQAALDEVGALTPDAAGLRGAVLLKAGTYRIAGTVKIRKSGVVLRGEGQGTGGTVLIATGTGQRTLIDVAGSGRPTEVSGSRRRVLDAYVPVGANRLRVEDAASFHVGDRVIVRRPSTQEWIDSVGMDACDSRGTSHDTADVRGKTCLDNEWQPGSKDLTFQRIVTAISGDRLTLDAPITNALDAAFGGGAVYRYTFPGRITQVGVEDLRGDSHFTSNTDENHGWVFINLSAVEDAWVQRITSVHYGYAAVSVTGSSRAVTVQDSSCLDPISQVTGGRRYSFNLNGGQLVLFQRVHTRGGRHDFVIGASNPGPNVFLQATAERANTDSGPHHRWSSGTLFDNVVTNKSLNVQNRGNSGSGHGWAGVDMVFWNCQAGTMNIQSPPGARSWAIGSRASVSGNGTFDSTGTPVWPPSLYLEQLEARLGPAALEAID